MVERLKNGAVGPIIFPKENFINNFLPFGNNPNFFGTTIATSFLRVSF